MLNHACAGSMAPRRIVFYITTALVIAQFLLTNALASDTASACLLNPTSLLHPDSSCHNVFRLPGALPSRLHYLADGEYAWVAAKFAFLPGDDAIVHMGGSSVALPNANYFVSRSILVAIANVASDIVMAESESFVYANMASASAYQTVKSNILGDCAWFSNTHGSSTLEPWMSPMAPGFNIPDAKQESTCQGRYAACGAGGSNYVFDSCENPFGSKLQMVHLFRMRCPSATADCDNSINTTHSIWFRIPMTYRSMCDDATGLLLSTTPASAPMLSFTTVTLYGESFSAHADYMCVFVLPLPQSNISLIHAKYINSSQLLCYIVDDFVPPRHDMSIGIEQEICSGGTCSFCPIRTSTASMQNQISVSLAFSFLPSVLKPTDAVAANFGSKVSISVAGGSLDAVKSSPIFPVTRMMLSDAAGFSLTSLCSYLPGPWPFGVLEFDLPEWPRDTVSVLATATIANFTYDQSTIHLYSLNTFSIDILSSWKSAAPLEITDVSRLINISGSGFVWTRLYSCVFSPLFDGTNSWASSIIVDADYVSGSTLRCLFPAMAGRYRLNVNENDITLLKSGSSVDVFFIESVLSMAPADCFASGDDFSLTVTGIGFDPNPKTTSYECFAVARDKTILSSSKSAVVVSPSVVQSPSLSTPKQQIVVCTFPPWIYSSGTYELQMINQRFSRYLGGSTLKFAVMPIWTGITPSSGANLLPSMITLTGYGLPVSLYIEATFRSLHDTSQSAKSLAAIPLSPFHVVIETPNWYHASLTSVVELAVAASSMPIAFKSGLSRTFAFVSVPRTLKYSPSVLDCGSSTTVVFHDTRPYPTNGTGYQCQLLSDFSEVTVPAVYTAETMVQCSFAPWTAAVVPSTLQLFYHGSKVGTSRSAPICKPRISSVSPTLIPSGSRSQVTIVGSFIDANVKYECIVDGWKSAAVYPDTSSSVIVCVIDAPKTSSVVNSFISLRAIDAESNLLPLAIQSSWKSLHPSVVCLNSKVLLTVTGAFFSQDNKHELVFDYQTVVMAEYLQGAYVRPFPLSRSSVVTAGIEVIGSTDVVFPVPVNELSNAIEIQVSLRTNGNIIPVDVNPNLRIYTLPFYASGGIIAGVGAQSLTSCAMPVHDLNNAAPACQTHPLSSLGRFPAGVACISANTRSFRLSLAGGLYAKLPGLQGENWLSHPSSTFVCDISGASDFKSLANGTLISANYSSSHVSNFVNNVTIECDVESSSFIALANGSFRYFCSMSC
jgi:hypothetical protein